MSNVDPTNELSDTIMAQKGFQANSRMITVNDETLETLVNLKQQLEAATVPKPGSAQEWWFHIKEGYALWQN